jgi:hypothetical protein
MITVCAEKRDECFLELGAWLESDDQGQGLETLPRSSIVNVETLFGLR